MKEYRPHTNKDNLHDKRIGINMIHKNVLMMVLLLIGSITMAAEPAAQVSQLSDESGFVSIFDGKTLDGWKGATTGYVAEASSLVCLKKGGGNLLTVKEYKDFVFRFEFRFEPDGNNGVSVRGQEIQILDDYAPKHKDLKPCQYHGSIYCKVPAKRGATKPAGEWNTEEIFVQGSHWKVTVNGQVTVDVDLSTMPEFSELAKRTKGPLGFLGHGARVEFRNLRVKEL
jgi:hypothetical protein